MPAAQVADKSTRTPDRVAASLAIGFVVLLLATELILSLPDETASASDVAKRTGVSGHAGAVQCPRRAEQPHLPGGSRNNAYTVQRVESGVRPSGHASSCESRS